MTEKWGQCDPICEWAGTKNPRREVDEGDSFYAAVYMRMIQHNLDCKEDETMRPGGIDWKDEEFRKAVDYVIQLLLREGIEIPF